MTQSSLPDLELWDGISIGPGETRDVHLAVSESYSGQTLEIPIQVRRAKEPGPTVLVCGAIHGDEVNGTGAIREMIRAESLHLTAGTLFLVPVMNILAFDRHSRYLPDRRDLNRCFPGDPDGSLASRLASRIFGDLISRCDFAIDLHTASVRRTNYPSIRADLSCDATKAIAMAFGCEVVVGGKGPKGSLRREATDAGCATIVMEGGEVWKVEPSIVQAMTQGVQNVLLHLNMLEGQQHAPEQQMVIEKTSWIRAERGGFLQFHVQPGEVVTKGQMLATNTSLLGVQQSTLESPYAGVILGMTTLPSVSPGEPVCHIGRFPKGTRKTSVEASRAAEQGLEERLLDDLASNVLVVSPDPDDQDK